MKIGEPLRRKEDFRLLTGAGRFSDDLRLDGQVHAAIVRSPHAHARIRKVSSEKAKAAPGVLGVFTGADCAADGLSPIDHTPMPSTKFDMKLTAPAGRQLFYGPHFLLPTDKARHVGEAIAMAVARTQAEALDAAELVEIDYEPMTGVAPVWDEVPDNVLIDTSFGDPEATERAFARAAHVVKMDCHVPRVTACALEPRTALGDYRDGRYTLWAPSGGAVRQKRDLAGVLGVDQRQVRVITADVGGNFGSRNRAYVEYGLVLWAARRLGRPVRFTASRAESLISDYQGRDLVMDIELALDAQGRFLALRASNVSNVGARCVSLSPLSKGSGLITGPYHIPAATLRSRAVFSNTAPTNPYRSSGRPEITFALERLVDSAARELGIDRVELRRRNLVPPDAMPYRNAVGMTYDSGTYEANLDLALRLADWSGFAARRDAALSRGRRLGIGLASYVESSIGSPKERAEIAVLPEGRVRVVIAGAPPPSRTIERIETELGWEFIQIYGLTETAPLLTINRAPAEWDGLAAPEKARRLSRAGVPAVGVRMKVDGEGEVLTRSNHVFEGYWNQPAETAKALVEGWFHTGDGGYNEGAYVAISDRKKDVIITGGENVSSIEVEDCLFQHPAVGETAVIGVPDEKWGETIKALVVLRPGQVSTERELIDFCRGRLAHFKCPTSIEFRDALTRTATGKLQKFKLREPYWAGRERRVN